PGGYAVGSEVDVRVVPHLLRRLGDALDETGGLGEGSGGEVGVGPAEEDPPVLDAVGLVEDVGRHPFVGHGCIQLARPNACGGSFRGWYRDAASPLECVTPRGCRLVVRHELPKLGTRVRFPSPALFVARTSPPWSGSGTGEWPGGPRGRAPQVRKTPGPNHHPASSEQGLDPLHRSLRPLARRRGGLIPEVLVVPRRRRAFLA